MRTALAIGSVILLLLLAGCAGRHSNGSLQYSAGSFGKMLQWKEFSQAEYLLVEEHRPGYREQVSENRDLTIVAHHLLQARLVDRDLAVATYKMEFTLLPSTTVRELTYDLDWGYLPVGDSRVREWQITSPFPKLPSSN